MASLTPRASGLWADPVRMGYFDNNDDESDSDDLEQQQLLVSGGDINDGRTPLDKTIDRIGMGSYQWALLSLCGFGWMADNMWIQAIAIILPRVQQHYHVPDSYIGTVSSSMFAGMMFGAVGWGTCSDLLGRSAAFNATLFFTSLFGLLTSFTRSFPSLCVLLFFLGSAVGGSMPTDGTLLLEHMPKGKRYLVTALSVFFSIGAVLSSVVALLVVPQHSCPPASTTCDVETENQGWKYLLITLGVITLSMFLARIAFFRLHESPRYLVHAGRPQEALVSLQMISRFNGSDLTIKLDDVDDYRPPVAPLPNEDRGAYTPFRAPVSDDVRTESQYPHEEAESSPIVIVHDADTPGEDPRFPEAAQQGANALSGQADIKDYHATRASPPKLDVSSTTAARSESPPPLDLDDSGITSRTRYTNATPSFLAFNAGDLPPVHTSSSASTPSSASTDAPHNRPPNHRRRSSRISGRSRRSSLISEKHVEGVMPRWMWKPLLAWLDRVALVLSPQWFRTTVLVWSAWCSMSLAYTMFNVFLPKLLETDSQVQHTLEVKSLEAALWDIVIYTIGGCPGAILGAYMVESRLGRRWSLAGSSFITAILCVVFVGAKTPLAVRASTVGISLSSTTMWAVLYGWTPEIFGTKVRGTACGIASALSRIGGMIAPMLGGGLLMIDRSVPVYTSVVVFAVAGICVLLLNEGERAGDNEERTIVH